MAKLPSFFRPWFEPLLGDLPDETRATCNACVMVNPPAGPKRDPGPFKADLKCCTYDPFVPNFALGALIELVNQNPSHPARAAVVEILKSAEPVGYLPEQPEENEETGEIKGFGSDESRACRFLDRKMGICTIWSHRSSVCWSYTCVSDRGLKGLEEWQELEEKGNRLEWVLAHEVLFRMGFTNDELDSGGFHEWKGRESEFFLQCYQVAKSVGPHDIADALETDIGENDDG